MADDPRSDARDEQVAAWLEVEPLDDVTRRRLVSTALRESPAPAKRPSSAWRWIAAAAAVVLVGGVTLAVVTAGGGNDEQRASTPVQSPQGTESVTPQSRNLAAAPDVGDFGDLDQPANLTKLRAALESGTAGSSKTEQTPAPAAAQAAGDASGAAGPACALPADATVVAEGTGTMGGRRATVFLLEHADGSRSYVAMLDDPCEIRQLP
jgi:hypothetical protein